MDAEAHTDVQSFAEGDEQEEEVTIPATVVAVPLNLRFPPGLVTRYVTNFVVQNAKHEYILSFFEAQPPMRFEDNAPLITSVPAECVGRIVVAPDRLPELVRVLQESMTKREQALMSQRQREG